ncbi:hypothetical protein ACFQZU_03620, partial [Streptomonospora algeriensis]
MLGISALETLPLLNEAVHSRVLEDTEHGFRFRDHRFRSGLANSLTRGVRRKLQAAANLGTENAVGDRGEESVAVLLRLAERMKPNAPGTAADLITHLLSTMADEDGRRPRIAADAVRLLAVTGRMEEARQLGESSLHGKTVSSGSGELLLALADTSYLHGRSKDAIEYSGAALAVPGLPAAVRVQLGSVRAHALLDEGTSAESVREAEEFALRAIDESYGLGSTEALVCGYSSRCRVAVEHGDLSAAIMFGNRAVGITEEYEGRARHRHPRIWLSAALAAADRVEEARGILTSDKEDCDRFGTSWSLPLWHLRLAELDLNSGRLETAGLEAEMGLRASKGSTETPRSARLLAVHAQVALHRDDREQARAHIGAARAMLARSRQSIPFELAWAGALLAEDEDDPQAALAEMADMVRDDQDRIRVLVRFPHAGARIAQWAGHTGDTGLAAAAADTAQRLADANPDVALLEAASLHARGITLGDTALLRGAVDTYGRSSRVMARAAALCDLAQAQADGDGADAAA